MRVLPKSEQGVFHRSRDTRLFTHPGLPGYLALVGGKLTAYRITAENVMRKLRQFLPPEKPQADTQELTLSRAPDDLQRV